MDLFDVMKSCLRRWYVFIPFLMLTVWYSHNVYTSVKPVYYSQAVIGLAPPSFRVDQAAPGQPVPRNGLLDIGGASLLANMTALGLRDASVVNRVVALGGLPDYVARLFPVPPTAPPIPLIMVENTAAEPAMAAKTLEIVTNETTSVLDRIQKQANVPPDMVVQTFVVSPPTKPVAAMPSRTRSTASVAVAGIALTVVGTVLLDVALTRRSRRRPESPRTPPRVARSAQPPGTVAERRETVDDVPESEPVPNDAADPR